MKKYILALLFLVSACRNEFNDTSTFVSIVNDVTDKHMATPTAKPILKIFKLSENKNSMALFRYAEIRSVRLSPVKSYNLPYPSETRNVNREPFFREKLILSFHDSIGVLLQSSVVKSDTMIEKHSECFRKISNELSVLSKTICSTRVLLVFSNLFENSSLFSVYSSKAKEALRKKPEELESIFESAKLLPTNLDGIAVVFVYEPTTPEDDELYNSIVAVYSNILNRRKAKVFIQASNSQFDL